MSGLTELTSNQVQQILESLDDRMASVRTELDRLDSGEIAGLRRVSPTGVKTLRGALKQQLLELDDLDKLLRRARRITVQAQA